MHSSETVELNKSINTVDLSLFNPKPVPTKPGLCIPGFYNMSLVIPAIAGTAVFIYGLLQMTWTDTARHICESGEKYLMCADCYLDGTCIATYLSDYCFTTSVIIQKLLFHSPFFIILDL